MDGREEGRNSRLNCRRGAAMCGHLGGAEGRPNPPTADAPDYCRGCCRLPLTRLGCLLNIDLRE